MAPRGKKTTRTSSLKVRAKRDPIGTAKAEVKKTGWGKYIIGSYLLGVVGGTAMAPQVKKLPIVGGILSVMTAKGARLLGSMNK